MDTIRTETKPGRAGGRAEEGFRVALLLREINARIGERVAAGLADSGLTLPQITLIKILAHGGERGITELARDMNAGKSTVVGIVDRLEREGIVRRRRSTEDRREVTVAFSPGAASKVAAARKAVDACFDLAFRGLGDRELAGLSASLSSVLDALEKSTGAS